MTDTGHNYIHGLMFGHDRVYFHHKSYAYPKVITKHQAKQMGDFKAMNRTLIGKPVYRLSSDSKQKGVPTKLFLKNSNGQFVEYVLIIPK